jgi:hypothetical protein
MLRDSLLWSLEETFKPLLPPIAFRLMPRSRARWTLLKPIASRSASKRLGNRSRMLSA